MLIRAGHELHDSMRDGGSLRGIIQEQGCGGQPQGIDAAAACHLFF